MNYLENECSAEFRAAIAEGLRRTDSNGKQYHNRRHALWMIDFIAALLEAAEANGSLKMDASETARAFELMSVAAAWHDSIQGENAEQKSAEALMEYLKCSCLPCTAEEKDFLRDLILSTRYSMSIPEGKVSQLLPRKDILLFIFADADLGMMALDADEYLLNLAALGEELGATTDTPQQLKDFLEFQLRMLDNQELNSEEAKQAYSQRRSANREEIEQLLEAHGRIYNV